MIRASSSGEETKAHPDDARQGRAVEDMSSRACRSHGLADEAESVERWGQPRHAPSKLASLFVDTIHQRSASRQQHSELDVRSREQRHSRLNRHAKSEQHRMAWIWTRTGAARVWPPARRHKTGLPVGSILVRMQAFEANSGQMVGRASLPTVSPRSRPCTGVTNADEDEDG